MCVFECETWPSQTEIVLPNIFSAFRLSAVHIHARRALHSSSIFPFPSVCSINASWWSPPWCRKRAPSFACTHSIFHLLINRSESVTSGIYWIGINSCIAFNTIGADFGRQNCYSKYLFFCWPRPNRFKSKGFAVLEKVRRVQRSS